MSRGLRVQAAGERQAVAMVAFGAVLFSTGPVLIAGADVSGAVLSFWRLWIGVVALGLAFVVYGVRTGRWPTPRGWSWAARSGVVFGIHQLMLMTALQRTSVVDVVLMQVLAPIIVAVLAVRLFAEHPGVRFRLWSAVALAGAVVVALAGSSGPEGDVLGMSLAAGNVVFFAMYFVWSKQARDEIDVVPFLWGVLVVAGVVVSTYIVLVGEAPFDAAGSDVAAAAAVALLPGAVGHFISTWPLRWVPANIPPLIQLGIPFLAGFQAWVFLGQGITLAHLIGGVVTIAGVAGAILSPAGRRMVAKEDAVLATGTG